MTGKERDNKPLNVFSQDTLWCNEYNTGNNQTILALYTIKRVILTYQSSMTGIDTIQMEDSFIIGVTEWLWSRIWSTVSWSPPPMRREKSECHLRETHRNCGRFNSSLSMTSVPSSSTSSSRIISINRLGRNDLRGFNIKTCRIWAVEIVEDQFWQLGDGRWQSIYMYILKTSNYTNNIIDLTFPSPTPSPSPSHVNNC